MKRLIYLFSIALSLITVSCNDSYMDLDPKGTLTEKTVFSNYNTFKTYAWGLYNVFTNDNILRRAGTTGYSPAVWYRGDVNAGYLMNRNGSGNPYAFQTIQNATSGNGWAFGYIRQVNVMLDNIDNSIMTEKEKEHWRSVGYFFRAYFYMELIARFGDVPWIDHTLGTSETDIAYGPRTPRKEVADHVLDDLLYAQEHIKEAGDGENTINVHVVRALISRFALFEGTWRKYHDLGDYDKYFTACIDASEKLMKSYPTLHNDYSEELTSDLKGMDGVILYLQYIPAIMEHHLVVVERSGTQNVEMPQHIVDMYLCKDGKPISGSQLYEFGKPEKSMYSIFRNRDLRLLETVTPPYKVNRPSGAGSWDYTGNNADREFIDVVGATPKEYLGKTGTGTSSNSIHKKLPLLNWSGNVLQIVPHFSTNTLGTAWCQSRSGNYVYKFYNLWDNSNDGKGTSDIPLFKIDEVLLNYAEAKFEVGKFDQSVANTTINLLRKRAQVSDMVVSDIDANFDANRDQTVDPVLWEIRRERIVELMGEGFGFYDIRRWKKAPWFINHIQYGTWANKSDIGTGKLVDLEAGYADTQGKTEGYVYMYNDPVVAGMGWLDKYYLYQVPTNEIALNPQLAPNNPGWD